MARYPKGTGTGRRTPRLVAAQDEDELGARETETIPDRDEGADDIELDILNELRNSPDDVTWTVSVDRVGTSRDGLIKDPYLFDIDGTQVRGLHARLQRDWGTGRYRVRVLRNGRQHKRFDICVEAPARAPEPSRNSEISEVLRAMQEQNERTVAMMTKVLEQKQTSAADPLAVFERAVRLANELRSPAPASASSSDSGGVGYVEAFKQALEMFEKMGGGGGGASESNFIDLVRDFIKSPALGVFLRTMLQNAPPATAALPAPAAPGSSLPAPPATSSGVSSGPVAGNAADIVAALPQTMQQQIRAAADDLIGHAKANSDPGPCAEWIAKNWEREFIETVIGQPQWFDVVCAIAPEARNYHAWLTCLRDELRDIFDEIEEPEAAAGAAPIAPNGAHVVGQA